jgi:hypothetical protein
MRKDVVRTVGALFLGGVLANAGAYAYNNQRFIEVPRDNQGQSTLITKEGDTITIDKRVPGREVFEVNPHDGNVYTARRLADEIANSCKTGSTITIIDRNVSKSHVDFAHTTDDPSTCVGDVVNELIDK